MSTFTKPAHGNKDRNMRIEQRAEPRALAEPAGASLMALVGYGRVSSEGQDYKTQTDALKAAGCKQIFAEKKSGTTTEGRVELQRAIEACEPGDVLVIVRLDRMARSLIDLLGIMKYLEEHEIEA